MTKISAKFQGVSGSPNGGGRK